MAVYLRPIRGEKRKFDVFCLAENFVSLQIPIPEIFEHSEETCRYVCPIKRKKGDFKWRFDIEEARDQLFDV